MEDKCFFWLTGIDTEVHRLAGIGSMQSHRDVDIVYQEVCLQICKHLQDEGIITEFFGMGSGFDGFSFNHFGKRIAVFCTQPTPLYLMELVSREDFSHVVFLRTLGTYGRQSYVQMAEDMNYSFIRQQLPEYIYKTEDSKNIINAGPFIILGNNNNVTIQNIVNRKSRLERLLDIIKSITAMLKFISLFVR